MRSGLIAVVVLLLGACASQSGPSDGRDLVVSEGVKEIAAESADGSVSEADERVRCKRERILGSNRRQKVCMTVAEWREREEASQESLLERSRRGSCVGCGGDG